MRDDSTSHAPDLRSPEPPSSGESGDAERRSSGVWRRIAPHAAAALLILAAVAWLLRLLDIAGPNAGQEWIAQLLLGLALLAATALGAYLQNRIWKTPVQRLIDIIPRIRSSEMPIDALDELRIGPAAPIVPAFEQLLRDIRGHRAELARLEREIGQRVANRTDALERRLGSLRHQATRDALTGLLNRRMLDEHLPRLVDEHLRARRQASEGAAPAGDLCVMMVDVDHFKPLNDTLGHAAGDELLRSIGQLIRSTIRANDQAFRCGGDEFVIVLDRCAASAGEGLAARLTQLVDGVAAPLRLPHPPRLSIGLAYLSNVSNPSPQGLLEAADRMLYEVKRARRSRMQVPVPSR